MKTGHKNHTKAQAHFMEEIHKYKTPLHVARVTEFIGLALSTKSLISSEQYQFN